MAAAVISCIAFGVCTLAAGAQMVRTHCMNLLSPAMGRPLIIDAAQAYTGFGYYDVSPSNAMLCLYNWQLAQAVLMGCLCCRSSSSAACVRTWSVPLLGRCCDSRAGCAWTDTYIVLSSPDGGVWCACRISCVLQVRVCWHWHSAQAAEDACAEGAVVQTSFGRGLPCLHQQRIWHGDGDSQRGSDPMVRGRLMHNSMAISCS